jgi:hypothetical protein
MKTVGMEKGKKGGEERERFGGKTVTPLLSLYPFSLITHTHTHTHNLPLQLSVYHSEEMLQ